MLNYFVTDVGIHVVDLAEVQNFNKVHYSH
jgi:hypothetical protein